jgi:hypothetical protein
LNGKKSPAIFSLPRLIYGGKKRGQETKQFAACLIA